MSTKPEEPKPLTADDVRAIALELIQAFRQPSEEQQRRASALSKGQALVHEQIRVAKIEREQTQKACPHLRDDNTSAIAWMQNSDLVFRGVCQRCNKLFSPESDPEEYERMRAVSTLSPLQAAAMGALAPRSDTVRK